MKSSHGGGIPACRWNKVWVIPRSGKAIKEGACLGKKGERYIVSTDLRPEKIGNRLELDPVSHYAIQVMSNISRPTGKKLGERGEGDCEKPLKDGVPSEQGCRRSRDNKCYPSEKRGRRGGKLFKGKGGKQLAKRGSAIYPKRTARSARRKIPTLILGIRKVDGEKKKQ